MMLPYQLHEHDQSRLPLAAVIFQIPFTRYGR